MAENDQNSEQSKYFAAKEANETVNVLLSKADDWFNRIEINGYLDKIRQMWMAYHGAYYEDIEDSHNITFSGEQGELVNISINHIRNIATNMKTLITSSRPAMQARSTNTDYKSLVQTKLANGLLDYYLREKKLENYLERAVEYALVLGSGYIKMEWNETAGDVYDYNDETGFEIREGDIEFSNLSPFDVVFDGSREDSNHDWVICRSFKNKYDLAAKYPEYKSKIEQLQTKDELLEYHFTSASMDDTDLIPVYEFYHKRTEAMEDGRYMLFLSDDITLIDSPMPYRDLPVYRITPGEYLGTPYGYSPLFDLLPIQDAINSSYSTILTNHNAFGVSNVVVPRGADINVDFISGGLNIIEGNFTQGEPKSLNLTQTPKEIFDFMQILERQMETISGINAVARGNPPSNLKSGNAMALMTSMSIQYMSGLQRSYVQLIEDIGTGLVNVLKDFASVPRIAMITGKSNRTEMKEFTGDDLSSINRVIVDIGNPLAKTTAGRVEMAEQMLQMGIIKTPEQYFTVINTGKLDSMTEDTQSELMLIKSENERLVDDKTVVAVATDQHSLHIKEHRAVLADPELRFNPELVQRTLDHIQEHLDLLRATDPNMLTMIQEQPLGPVGGSPIAQAPGQPPAPSNVPGQPPAPMNVAGQLNMEDLVNMPNLPQPPGPFENAPVTADDTLPES
jgi:hypothetical protein